MNNKEAGSQQCVTMTHCPAMLEDDQAPTNLYVCGFDEDKSLVKICCPTLKTTSEPVVRVLVPPQG